MLIFENSKFQDENVVMLINKLDSSHLKTRRVSNPECHAKGIKEKSHKIRISILYIVAFLNIPYWAFKCEES